MLDPISILPPNSTKAERAMEAAVASTRPNLAPIRALYDPTSCPSHVLDHLAWAISVDYWDAAYPENVKRDIIAASIDVHRIKGTPQALRDALIAAGFGEARVVEGYGTEDYDGSRSYDGAINYGEPDHWAEYRVYLTRPISIKQADLVRKILDAVTPVHEHLVGFFFQEAAHTYDAEISYDGTFTYGAV